jgi:hypothetical protein
MQMGCLQAYTCASACYEFTKQNFLGAVVQLGKIWHNREAFQTKCILALEIIRGINLHCHTHYFPYLIRVLDTAPGFDFYGCLRLLRYFLCPYTAERLDEYAILDQLEGILCELGGHLGMLDAQGKKRDPLIRQFAQEQLTAFLEIMTEEDLAFRTPEEVKTLLHHWFEEALKADLKGNCDPHRLNLQNLNIVLKNASWAEVMVNYTFILVDIACVPAFLQEWKLIDLAPYANEIGRFPLFSWIAHQSLDIGIWKFMTMGFLFQFLDAAYALWKESSSPEKTKNIKCLLIASLAECLYSLSMTSNYDRRLVNGLAIIAKSLGLFTFLIASKPTFFDD